MRALGNIEGKLDGTNQRLDTINGRLNRHDTKIDDIDLWRANLKGMIAIITVVGGALAGLTVTAVKWFLNK